MTTRGFALTFSSRGCVLSHRVHGRAPFVVAGFFSSSGRWPCAKSVPFASIRFVGLRFSPRQSYFLCLWPSSSSRVPSLRFTRVDQPSACAQLLSGGGFRLCP